MAAELIRPHFSQRNVRYCYLSVEDNGIGMTEGQENLDSIGLKNIKTRVDACKGKINIDSSERGTIVIIEIPINTIK